MCCAAGATWCWARCPPRWLSRIPSGEKATQLWAGLGASLPAGLTAAACRLWFEQCAFTDQQNSGTCPHPYKQPCEWGQRPTVIMRGLWSSRKTHDHRWHLGCTLPRVPAIIVRTGDADMQLVDQQGPVPGVYLVRFDTVIFTGGGVQCE